MIEYKKSTFYKPGSIDVLIGLLVVLIGSILITKFCIYFTSEYMTRVDLVQFSELMYEFFKFCAIFALIFLIPPYLIAITYAILVRMYNIMFGKNKQTSIKLFVEKDYLHHLKYLDLEIISIKTLDGQDIKYMRDINLDNISEFNIDVKNYPDSNFVLIREDYNSDLVNSIIDMYTNDKRVSIELNTDNINKHLLEHYTPLEKKDRYSILNDKLYKYFRIKGVQD